MRSRTVLFGRHPVGAGTTATESLTSFLARLCVARSLTACDVLDELVRPLLDKDVLPPRRRLSYFLSGSVIEFDGMGRVATEAVGALEQLTGILGLAEHTFLPWKRLFSPMSAGALMRGGKRWCPLCFREQDAVGVEHWEPLLWRLAPATRCARHLIAFSEQCPHCKRPQRVLSQAAPMGMCEYCSRELWNHPGVAPEPFAEDRTGPRELWESSTSRSLARMLMHQHEASRYANRDGFAALLERSRATFGSGSMQRLADHLGVERKTVTAWRDQRVPFRISSFLSACLLLEEEPVRVAFAPYGPQPDYSCTGMPFSTSGWYARQSVGGRPRIERPDRDRTGLIGRTLDEAISEGGQRSASSVAKFLGISISSLRGAFPEKYRELVHLHAEYRVREHDRPRAGRAKAIRSAVDALVAEGRNPSRTRTFKRAGVHGRAHHDPALCGVWQDSVAAHRR